MNALAYLRTSMILTVAIVYTTQHASAQEIAQPPCTDQAGLAKLFTGTIVYEGDPVEGEDSTRSFDVWVIGAPDWTPRLVVGEPGFDGHPSWSPDGTRIVYSGHQDRNPDLHIVDPKSTQRRSITTSENRDDYPHWLPEGIVYTSGRERRIVDPDTGDDKLYRALDERIEHFVYSPDRSQMATVVRPAGASDIRHLYLATAGGELLKPLADSDPRDMHPFWSPDGRAIVYSAGDGRRDGEWEVYLVDVESGEKRQLTHNPGADWACGWSPDGKWVLITSEYEGNWDIYAIRPDGSDRTRITCHKGNARYASWTFAEPLRESEPRSSPFSLCGQDPIPRVVHIPESEMPDLRTDEVACYMFRKFTHRRIRGERNLADNFVMILHKLKMTHQPRKRIPTRKLFNMNDESGQFSDLLNVRIHNFGRAVKILFGQRTFRFQNRNSVQLV